MLIAVVAMSIVLASMRPLSNKVRVTFDVACFVAISLYLYLHGASPLMPAIHSALEDLSPWPRVVAALWWMLAARVAVAAVWMMFHRTTRSRQERLFFDVTAAAINIAIALVIIIGVMQLPITGLFATSGIAAILLGLAMQNTLADVFAGIAVSVESPFGIGDRISIGDNIEGQVVQINWRSIHVQTDTDDVAIVPNNIVTKAQLINRSLPTTRRSATVDVPCDFRVSPEWVIDRLLEATLLCPTILQTPAPKARFARFGSKRNRYTISFNVVDSAQVGRSKSMLLRHAWRLLSHAGVLSGGGEDRRGFNPAPISTLELLRSVVLFEHLSPVQLEALGKLAVSRVAERDQVLFSEGEASAALYIVASGIVEVSKRLENEQTHLLGSIGPGDYIGSMSLLTGEPYAATATARVRTHAIQIPYDAIVPLVKGDADMAEAFETSARRGRELLQEEASRSASAENDVPLRERIRAFFHRDRTKV
jgi:small-conductance mechanosensitive channel/CRP-like cAMP-binding protein